MAYADKRASQRLESMDARFARGGGATRRGSSTVGPAAGTRRRIGPSGPAPRDSRPTSAERPGSTPDEVRRLALDRRRAARPPATCRMRGRTRTTDDDRPARLLLGRRRAVGRARGRSVRRRHSPPRAGRRSNAGTLRGNRNIATGPARRPQRAGRDAGHVRRRDAGRRPEPGALVVKNEDRDAFLATMALVAPGQRAGHPRCESSRARRRRRPSGSGRRDRRRPAARSASSGRRKGGALAGWIEAEARERGLALAPGAAKVLAERVGGFVQEGDAERRQQTRIASMELDKLALYRGHGADRSRRRPGARRRGGPGFGLGVHRRRRRAARRAGARAPRAAPRDDPRAGPARGPAPARPRAPRDSATGSPRASGCRRSARRWASPASSGWTNAARPGEALDDDRADRRARRAGRARCDGQGRARARRSARRSGAWRSVCG